ncbi:hypothetical protein MRX96_015834 [Rhipicephalus microplus]
MITRYGTVAVSGRFAEAGSCTRGRSDPPKEEKLKSDAIRSRRVLSRGRFLSAHAQVAVDSDRTALTSTGEPHSFQIISFSSLISGWEGREWRWRSEIERAIETLFTSRYDR